MKTVVAKRERSNVISIAELSEEQLSKSIVISLICDEFGILTRENYQKGDFRWLSLNDGSTECNHWHGKSTALATVKDFILRENSVYIFDSWTEAAKFMSDPKKLKN